MGDEEKQILVVDDDDAIRVMLLTVLKRRGLTADAATNGGEALTRLSSSHYSVMLLDLMMPRESGWDVLREMAQWPSQRRPIVIVLTAGPEPLLLDPALVSGTVRKPFDIDLLVETVSACVNSESERSKTIEQTQAAQTVN